MALQKNSAGFWVDADGHYPVLLFHARKGDDGLHRFRFMAHPLGALETVESDTRYAYLPSDTFETFVARKWGRPLIDAEAEAVNAGAETEETEEPEAEEDFPIEVPPVIEVHQPVAVTTRPKLTLPKR